ncbi:MAG: glycosyltransferase family 4 protein [Hyphomonadaceae bacterium]
MSADRRLKGATILQVIPDLAAGGAERTTIEVSEALSEAGARALVASAGGRLESQLAAAGGELIRMPNAGSKNPIDLALNTRRLVKIIKERKVDIVHARSRAPAWSALAAARSAGVRFVTTYHGIYSGRSAPKRLYNSVMARGDAVIANSDYTADLIRTQYPDATSRIVTIPRGVDLNKFRPDAVSEMRTAAMARAWHIEEKRPLVILLPARLTAWKGQREAVLACGQLLKRGLSGWKLILAGDAQGREDYVKALRELIADQGLADHAEIVGHCDDMPAALALSDIVVVPSVRPEAFGRSAAEAGAMAVPVVGSRLGAQQEVIVEGETGLLAAPGQVGPLADAIADLIGRGDVGRRAMGAAAQQRVRDLYSTRALQTATLAVYERLLVKAE